MRGSFVLRVQELTHLDCLRLSRRPAWWLMAAAGVVAAVASLLGDAVLVALGRSAFHPPSTFGPFHFGSYAPLTLLGVAGATVGWAILVQVSSRPRWVLPRAAVLTTIVLLVPDFWILPNNPAGGVATLMVMHLMIAVVTYWSLVLVAPVRGVPVSGPLFPSLQPTGRR